MTPEKPIHFTLQVEGGFNTDTEEIHSLTNNLLNEIRASDVEEACIPETKGDPITAGMITLEVLPAVIPTLIVAVQAWLLRQQNQTLRIKIGEIEVEIPRDLPEARLEQIVDQVMRIAGKN